MTNTEIVKGMYAAFNRGDIELLLNCLAANVEWTTPGESVIPFAGRYSGRGGVAAFFQRLVEASDSDPLVIDSYVEQGNTVVALGTSSVRSKPLRKQYSTSFAMVFTLSGGKVTKFQDYFDTAAVAAAYAGAQAARP